MARPKKTKTMASNYEQQRQENIRRNQEMIASILRQKSQLSSLLSPPKPKPNKISPKKRTKTPAPPPTTPLRRSLRSRGLPPSVSAPAPISPSPTQEVPRGQFSLAEAFVGSHPFRPMIEHACRAVERTELGDAVRQVDLGIDPRLELGLKEANVRRVAGERIMNLKFLPVSCSSIIISGNKQGYIGIWDVDGQGANGDSDGLFLFYPHRNPVSGILVHPSSATKIYSSCYGGDLCLMDLEKEMFDIIHSSDYAIYSLSQSPHDHNSLFLGEWGQVKTFDERTRKVVNEWELHERRINTIDFHPENSNLIATSSTDGFVRIWDLRCIDKDQPKSIKEVAHNRAVHSAYFSPTGNGIVSTSADDTVCILSGSQYKDLSIIKHNNQTGRWLSSFRAIWGWNDSYILIGNMQRAVDVISTDDNITTPLQSEFMTNIPCRFAAHPFKEGHLACAGGGKLYLWTKL